MTKGSWLGESAKISLLCQTFPHFHAHLWEVWNLVKNDKGFMTWGKVRQYPYFVRLFHTSTPLISVELRMKKESRDLVASTGHLCHFFTAATKFSCCCFNKEMSPLFFISRSISLSQFFSLSFAGLPPTFSFSQSFSCSTFQICGHDN